MPHEYRFCQVERTHFPILRAWMTEPHVANVWGDPDNEIALIEEDIDGGDCQMLIVSIDGTNCAFIQDWNPHLAGVPHFRETPAATRAIDTLLGETRYLGQGHAKAYVRLRAEQLLEQGAPMVVTDPRLTNPHGIAMYRGAGFRPGPVRVAEDDADVLCMAFRTDWPCHTRTPETNKSGLPPQRQDKPIPNQK